MKGSTKIIGILFVIVVGALLITHWVIIRNVGAEFTAKETALVNQVTDLNLQLENKVMENSALNVKLAVEGIKVDVLRNNYGNAGEAIDNFRSMLIEGGCKKMDELYPVFEDFKVNLLKKQNTDALANLEQIKNIIFGEQPAAVETKAEVIKL